MAHPFFETILLHPNLCASCNLNITALPEAWQSLKTPKAIVLGADPTNDGISGKRGLIELDYVFGIGHKYENIFWGAQKRNLSKIGLQIEDIYAQNICRNYFKNQTAKNKTWQEVAEIWVPFLIEELSSIPSHVPVLASAEVIMKFLVKELPEPETIYKWEKEYHFYSNKIDREILPLYRHPKYTMNKSIYPYKNYLKERFENK